MNTNILVRLREEHRNINGLLCILERQLMGIKRGDKPDYRLMYDIVHYLTYYPDRYHHPFEDIMFGRVAELRPDLSLLIAGFEQQHKQIAFDGNTLRDMIGEIIDGLLVPRDLLLRTGTDYINNYRVHMQAEENKLFDIMPDILNPADLIVLVSAFHWQSDPVFSGEATREYQHLRECISAEGAGEWPWKQVNDHACPVCSSV